jgi:hypothetical protein
MYHVYRGKGKDTYLYQEEVRRAVKCSGYREENCSQHQALVPSLHNKTFIKKSKTLNIIWVYAVINYQRQLDIFDNF